MSGVNHANLHVQDVTALDFAIHDCSSLAMLEAVTTADPGYLDLSMTTVRAGLLWRWARSPKRRSRTWPLSCA